MEAKPAGGPFAMSGRAVRSRVLAAMVALGPALPAVAAGAAAPPDSVSSPDTVRVADGTSVADTAPVADGTGIAGHAQPPDRPVIRYDLPADGETVWTAVHLPDGAVLYVRYGEPGAVHISSGPDSTAPPDTAGMRISAPPAAVAAGETRETVLRILREELARLRLETAPPVPVARALEPLPPPADGRTRDLVVIRRTVPPAADTLGALDADTLGTPVADTLALLPETARERRFRAAGDTAASGGTPEETAATSALDRVPGPAEAGAGARTVRERFLGEGLFRTSLVVFETGRTDLLPSSRSVLQAVGEVLREFPAARLRVEGHSDPRGPADLNRRLSLERAEAVRDFLVGEMGIDAGRIETVGYGEDRPLAEGRSATALTLNRRVEFRILNPEALRRIVD